MNAEQRILAWLERADFNGTGCWHSQDTIARATGCCRRTVIRSVAALEADGRIRVQRFARGSRRPNVYRVRDWNPHKRSGVLNVLASIREARYAECHSKRTAQPSKGSDPLATPSSLNVVGQRCGRARPKIQVRRSSCMEAKRHLHSVETTGCLQCAPLIAEKDERIEWLEGSLEKACRENSELADKYLGAHAAAEAAGRAAVAAKGRRTKQAKAEAEAEQVETVIAHWRKHRPKTSNAFGEPGTDVWDLVAKALVMMSKDEAGPVEACKQAIDGLHLAPYQEFDKRFAVPGPGRELRNKIQHALGSSIRIERCREIARRAGECSLDAKYRAWELSGLVHDEWSRVLFAELHKRPGESEGPRFVSVDGIEVREDGS